MESSDLIALAALIVSLGVAAFTVYQHFNSKKALLEFKMSIGRGYSTDNKGIVVTEHNPTTRIIVRNLSSRPSAILEVRAKNPAGSILFDIDKKPPGGEMPLKLDPWDVKIISTTWPTGEHTEGLYFCIKDIDENDYLVYDYTNNRRIAVGGNIYQEMKARSKGA